MRDREEYNFLLLAGLYAVTFLSIAMGALLAADTLAGEISSGTIQTIVTKPIRRSDVVFGKWLGFAVLLGLYFLLMSGGTVLSVWLQSGYAPSNLLVGSALIYLEALLIMTISLACSSAMLGSGDRRRGIWACTVWPLSAAGSSSSAPCCKTRPRSRWASSPA